MKRAVLSVTNKYGIVDFAKGLIENGYEIISTGGTYKVLEKQEIPVINIEDVTKFPEILDGRVKTLNPYIHGGILYRRDKSTDVATVDKLGISSIDLVCVNLYEFKKAIDNNLNEEDIIEEIDIGGPTLIRAAAKNFKDVIVVTDINDYNEVVSKLSEDKIDYSYKKKLAGKAFKIIADYDNNISSYFNEDYEYLTLKKVRDLSYGENPHQNAFLYRKEDMSGLMDFNKLWGKDMSYNNYSDTYAALELLIDFKDEKYFSASIKHSSVCGAATGINELDSYIKCFKSDSVAVFGGILAFNYKVTKEVAEMINKIFIEIVVAPAYDKEAFNILSSKKNIRLLEYKSLEYGNEYQLKDLDNLVIKQERDRELHSELEFVTENKPNEKEIEDLIFANKIVKNIKSNGIAIVRDKMLLGVSGGQTARVYALKSAIKNSLNDLEDSVLASDAFFPFNDSIEFAKEHGIKVIIQPGGSRNDSSLIDFCNESGLKMIFTKRRHFKH